MRLPWSSSSLFIILDYTQDLIIATLFGMIIEENLRLGIGSAAQNPVSFMKRNGISISTTENLDSASLYQGYCYIKRNISGS